MPNILYLDYKSETRQIIMSLIGNIKIKLLASNCQIKNYIIFVILIEIYKVIHPKIV